VRVSVGHDRHRHQDGVLRALRSCTQLFAGNRALRFTTPRARQVQRELPGHGDGTGQAAIATAFALVCRACKPCGRRVVRYDSAVRKIFRRWGHRPSSCPLTGGRDARRRSLQPRRWRSAPAIGVTISVRSRRGVCTVVGLHRSCRRCPTKLQNRDVSHSRGQQHSFIAKVLTRQGHLAATGQTAVELLVVDGLRRLPGKARRQGRQSEVSIP
jgi:hypothetical protein